MCLEAQIYMIISIDAEKSFNKIQHPFIWKILKKLGVEGTYHNIIKATMTNQSQTSYQMEKKTKSIFSKIMNKAMYLLLLNVILETLARPIRQ